jgi:sulfur dioxygenase
MIFRQLFDQASSCYTYLLADSSSGEAILIDTVFEQSRRDRALLNELGLKLAHVIDTHCHADHVTGAWLLKQQTHSEIGISAAAGIEGADNYFEHGAQIHFGSRYITARATPGHTSGCMSYVLDDESIVFTGDSLLIRGCGRTDFQEGDARTLYQSIKMQILTLPEQTHIYPGHDYRGLMLTTVAEEKKFNSRFGGNISENDFAGYMENLGLPHPGKIDIAVPANLKSGRPDSGGLPEDEPSWAPLRFTFGGIWEIDSNWLIDHLADVQIIDVREEDEFDGPLGHIENAKLIPLGKLNDELENIAKDSPIVTVCRSGARSAQATIMLRRAGLGEIANLHGGMLHWRDQGLSVSGGIVEPDYQI